MANLNEGPWGELSGKLGNYVVTKRNGKTIVQKKGKRTGESTPAQLNHQAKFSAATDFYRPLSELVMVTFRKKRHDIGTSIASGDFLTNAITGEAPDFTIDYEKVKVSKGSLPLPLAPAANNQGSTINFTWKDNSILGSANPADKAVIVVHCPARNQSFFLDNIATRNSGAATADASVFEGEEVHTWLAFIKADKKKASDSVYLGKMNL